MHTTIESAGQSWPTAAPNAPVLAAADEHGFSVYELDITDGVIDDVHGNDFDRFLYSRFKYSDPRAADYYGVRLADAALAYYSPDELADTYIAASATKYVPSAAVHAMRRMVSTLALRGAAPKGEVRVDRAVVRAVDYATLSEAEREESNASRGIAVPDMAARAIRGANVLVIDDLSASGKTAEQVRQAICAVGVARVAFGHIATLTPAAASDPGIESIINQQHVSSLADLAPLLADPSALNARTCKFILRGSPEEVTELAATLPPRAAAAIVHAMVADEYHTMPEYASAFQLFRTVAAHRAGAA